MGKKSNRQLRKYYEYSLLFFFSLITLILTNKLIVIPDSHFYVSRLENNVVNESVFIYKLLRAPIYRVTSPFYTSYDRYFLLSISTYFVLIFSIYRVVKTYHGKTIISFFILLLFSPLTFRLINFIIDTNLVRVFNVPLEAIHGLGPAHFGWVTYGFTPRILSGICSLLLIYYIHHGQTLRAGILFGLLFLVHPNNALSISLWLILSFTIYNYIDLKFAKFLLVLCSLLALFILLNSSSISAVSGTKDWYNLSYHINAPNFSGFYFLFNKPLIVLVRSLLTVLLASFLYSRNSCYKNGKSELLLIMSVTPVVIFFCSVILESFIRLDYLDISIIYKGIISSQVGLKILELSFFPLFISCNIYLKSFIDKYVLLIKHFLFIVLISLIFITIFYFLSGKATSNYNAIRWKYDYSRTLLEINNISGLNPMVLPIVYPISNVDSSYLRKYSNITTFYGLKDYIDANIEKNSLLIVPPYQDKFRDLFPDQEIFYQDVPDASLLLGGGLGSSILNDRINLLFNYDVLNFSHYYSNYYWSDMRKHYLNLKEDNLFRIKSNYTDRNVYIITEYEVYPKLKLLYKSDAYCMYEL